MATRPLTDKEIEAFDGCHKHTNRAHAFCCPHCFVSSPIHGVGTNYAVAKCPAPDCGKLFIAWREYEPVSRSAFLPAGDAPDRCTAGT